MADPVRAGGIGTAPGNAGRRGKGGQAIQAESPKMKGKESWHEHATVCETRSRSRGGRRRFVSIASGVPGGLTGSNAPFHGRSVSSCRPAAAGRSRMLTGCPATKSWNLPKRWEHRYSAEIQVVQSTRGVQQAVAEAASAAKAGQRDHRGGVDHVVSKFATQRGEKMSPRYFRLAREASTCSVLAG